MFDCKAVPFKHGGRTANKRKRQENNMGRCIFLTTSMVGNHILCFTAKLSYLNMMPVQYAFVRFTHPNSTTCGSLEKWNKLANQFWRLKKYGCRNHIAPLLYIFSKYLVNFVIFNLWLTFSLSLAEAYRCLGQTIRQERVSSSPNHFNSRTCLCCQRSGVRSKGKLLK